MQSWVRIEMHCTQTVIIQDVNEHVYTVPGTSWNTRYPDWVRNIHVVNGRGYTFPGEVK